MTICFYRWDPGQPDPSAAAPPPGIDIRIWRPAEDGFPPPGSAFARNLVWWGFSKLGFFARPRFAEVSFWRDQRRVHRLIVTARWYRFPFMRADDLQIGDVWTDPEFRGLGLARAAIALVHRRFAGPADRLWYVAEAQNLASIRLIESLGYRRIGVGQRSRPLGLRALGRFHLQVDA